MIEMSIQKSTQLAHAIELIKMQFSLFDIEYAKTAVKSLKEQANFQDSAAVLNPSYLPEKSNLIKRQADMLQKLIEVVEIGLDIDDMKRDVADRQKHISAIQNLFL